MRVKNSLCVAHIHNMTISISSPPSDHTHFKRLCVPPLRAEQQSGQQNQKGEINGPTYGWAYAAHPLCPFRV